jgi:hypothetical protein
MICLFTGVRIGHSSFRSRLKCLLQGVQAAFVKEKVHKSSEMDEGEDTEVLSNFLPMEEVEVEEDVPVDDGEIDEDDEGWEVDHGELSDSEEDNED